MRLTIREALLDIRRAPLLSALTVLMISFSLFAFGLFSLVAINVGGALRQVEERVEIRAFILDGTPVEAVAAAMGDIASFPEIARVDQVSPEEALERARKDMEEFSDVFGGAFLPASLEVRLKEGYRDPQTIKAVADRIRTYPFIDEVLYGQEWVEQLYRIRNVATAAGLVLGIAFAAVSVIIIGAAIRLAVLARAREISIMRLVGATDGFVRRPFLLDGFMKGLLGGALALLLTWIANQLVSTFLVHTEFFGRGLVVLGIVAGGIIGLAGSALSVGRHLGRV